MRQKFAALLSALALAAVWPLGPGTPGGADPDRDWPAYGGGPEGIRYSPLRQINRANVKRLDVAWTYDAADGAGGLQTNRSWSTACSTRPRRCTASSRSTRRPARSGGRSTPAST